MVLFLKLFPILIENWLLMSLFLLIKWTISPFFRWLGTGSPDIYIGIGIYIGYIYQYISGIGIYWSLVSHIHTYIGGTYILIFSFSVNLYLFVRCPNRLAIHFSLIFKQTIS